MFLYLVQHAEAKREEEDPSRPLTENGIQDIKKTASHASKLNIKVEKIFHSTKLRAKQTEEILSENLNPIGGVLETDGLAPMDHPVIWAERLEDIKDNIVLVGHLPHLGRLASLLLCRDSEKGIIAFRMAGIVCLQRNDEGRWSLQWMITPEIII
jgi:phosphohistidine phosphatase